MVNDVHRLKILRLAVRVLPAMFQIYFHPFAARDHRLSFHRDEQTRYTSANRIRHGVAERGCKRIGLASDNEANDIDSISRKIVIFRARRSQRTGLSRAENDSSLRRFLRKKHWDKEETTRENFKRREIFFRDSK